MKAGDIVMFRDSATLFIVLHIDGRWAWVQRADRLVQPGLIVNVNRLVESAVK